MVKNVAYGAHYDIKDQKIISQYFIDNYNQTVLQSVFLCWYPPKVFDIQCSSEAT